MRTLGRKIIVHRGETFTFRAEIFKNDGVTPYMLFDTYVNPYMVLTVSSNSLSMQGKYQLNSWLDLSTYHKFKYSEPYYVEDSVVSANTLPQGHNAGEYLYYTQDENGVKTFYYYPSNAYQVYSFVITKQFLNAQTKYWIESQYMYELSLMCGQFTIEVLTNTYKSVYPDREWIPTDSRQLYEEIEKCRPDLLKGIRWSAPLTNYSTMDVIQRPEPLIIKNNC